MGAVAVVAAGVFLPRPGVIFPGCHLKTAEEKFLMIFDKTRGRVKTLINDRITAPVSTALIISALAFIMAGLALALVITGERHADN